MSHLLNHILLGLLRFPRNRRQRAAKTRFAELENRMMLVAPMPFVDGSAIDSDNNGVFDSVSVGEFVTASKSTTTQSVGLFEFATPTTSEPGLMSRLTNLKLRVSGSNSPYVRIYAYAGNGQLTTSDATAAGTLIATTHGTDLGNLTLPTGLIATLGNPSHIGFRIEAIEGGISFYGMEYASGVFAAKLDSAGVLTTPQKTTLDFNNLQHGGVIVNGLSTYAEDGYKLTGGFVVYGQSSPKYTGSGAIATGFSTSYSTERYVLSRPGNVPFTLSSLMLYKDSADSPEATVLFTGTKVDGTIVKQAGTADQLSGRKITFVGFDDVVSVSWDRPRRFESSDTAPAYQFDNIQLQSEYPSTTAAPQPLVLQNSVFSITEKRADGVIGQLTATPLVTGQNLRYDLLSGGAGLFSVSTSGEVVLTNSKGLDFEANSQYPLIVRVSDAAIPSQYDIGTVTVRITNVASDQQQTFRPVADGDYVNGVVTTNSPTMSSSYDHMNFSEYNVSGIDWSLLRTAYVSIYVDPSSALGSLLYLHAYQGDGTVNVSDVSRTLTLVRTYTISGYGWQTIALDARILRNLVGDWSQLGLSFGSYALPSNAIRLQTEDGPMGGPRLTLGLWPNSAPVLNDVTWSVPEITGASLELHVTDADSGDLFNYSLVSSTLPGAFALTWDGYIYTPNSSLLDYETTPQITLVVKVTDSGLPELSDTATITVNLTNQNETPVVTPLTINAGTLTPGAVLGQLIATDSDPTTLTYRLGSTADGYEKMFDIDPATGVIRWKGGTAYNSTSFSVPSRVLFYVFATDSGSPARTGSGLVTVNFSDRPQAPALPETVNLSVSENAPAGSSVGTITASDANSATTLVYSLSSGSDLFSIDPATGLIKTLATFNYESGSTKSITVEVRDGVYASRRSYTVNITNVVEPPVLDDSTISILEFSPAGTLVKQLSPTFKDGVSPVTYSIVSGNVNNAFTINSATGKLTVTSSTSLSYVTRRSYTLKVKVADSTNPLLSDTAILTVNVTRPQRTPVLPTKSFTLPENSRAGSVVGTITATDPDTWERLTYSIESNYFEIVPTTGVIKLKAGVSLDYENRSQYPGGAYVTVKDGIYTVRTWVSIGITNVNEAPVVTNSTVSVNEFSPLGTNVTMVSVNDPETPYLGNNFSYAFSAGNSSGIFAINSLTGAITVAKPQLLNSQVVSQYVLTVRVIDSGTPRMSGTGTITVNVVSPAVVPVRQGADTGGLIGQILPRGTMGSSRTYTILSGNVGEAFAVHPTTGMLTVKTPNAIDILTLPEYQLVVRVSDGVKQEVVTRRIRVENNSLSLKTFSNAEGYASTTTRDALGIPTWQTPVAGNELVIRGGSGTQSRAMVRTSDRISYWDGVRTFLSVTVTGTVKNELSAETVINIYVQSTYTDVPTSSSLVIGGALVGRLVLQAGEQSQNKTYLIELGDFYPYSETLMAFSFRNELNGNQVTIDGSAGAVRVFQIQPTAETSAPYLNANDPNYWIVDDGYGSRGIYQSANIGPAKYWWVWTGYSSLEGNLIGVDSSGQWSSYWVNPYGQGSSLRSKFSISPIEIVTSTIITTRYSLYGRDAMGDWWRLDNLYNSQFTWTKVGNWSPSVNWVDVTVADFDGDGTEDFAGRNSATGQWTVTNGASFVNTTWGGWATNKTWYFVKSGDFTGDGRADLIGQSETGDWWMSRSVGNKFASPVLMGNWSPTDPAVEVVVGDFNLDMKADIAGRTVSGTWIYSKSQSSSFTTTVLGYWSDPAGWDQSQLDYGVIGYPSIASRNLATNEIWFISPGLNGRTTVRNVGFLGGTDVFVPGMSQSQTLAVTTIPAPRGRLLNPQSYNEYLGEVTPNTPTTTPVIPSSANPPANASSSGIVTPLAPFTSYNGPVVIDGDTALVQGMIGTVKAVQVLVKSGNSWVSQGFLRPDAAIAEGDYWAVALEGNVAVVFHQNHSNAYVYERSSSTWTQTAIISNADTNSGWYSRPRSIAIDGGRIAIPTSDTIYFYEKIGSVWTKTQSFRLGGFYINAVDAISLSGNRLAVQDDEGDTVQIFEYRDSEWRPTAAIPVIDSPIGDEWEPFNFGKSLTLSGDVLIVEGQTYNGRRSGAVAVYEFTANGWQLVTEFKNSNNSTSYSSPQFSDNRILMKVSTLQGAKTQLYIRKPNGWQLAQEWADASDNMAIDGRSIVIAGPSANLKLITLLDLAPVITNSDASFTIPELSPVGTVVGQVLAVAGAADSPTYQITSGNTGDVFAIDPMTGVITVRRGALLDFETRPSYRITVGVKNRDSSLRVRTGTYNISLTNAADVVQVTAPEITVRVNGTEIVTGGSVDFGGQHFSVDEVRTLVVSNSGSSNLVLQPVSVPEGFSVVSNFAPGQLIAPGSSANLVIRFDGQTPGTTVGELRWTSNDADESVYRIRLTGTRPLILDRGKVELSVDGALVLDGGVIDFNVTTLGTPVSRTLTITNRGTGPLDLTDTDYYWNTRIDVEGRFTLQNNGQEVLAPGESTTFTVTYDASLPQDVLRAMGVGYNYNRSDYRYGQDIFSVTLRGHVPAPRLEASLNGKVIRPASQVSTPYYLNIPVAPGDFGLVAAGATFERDILFRNIGDRPLDLASQVTTTGPFTLLTAVPAGTVLAPGETKTIRVRFTGSQDGGVHVGTLGNLPIQARVDVQEVSVRTIASPGVSGFSSGPILDGIGVVNFGSIRRGTWASIYFEVSNTGTRPLTLQPISIPTGYRLVGNNFTAGQTLAPGASVDFQLQLDTQANGTFGGEITFATNDNNENPFNIAVNGNVVAIPVANVTVAGSSYISSIDFGQVDYGVTADKTLTVFNSGDGDLVLQPLVVPSGFSVISNFTAGQVVAPGQTSSLTIRYNGTANVSSQSWQLSTNDKNVGGSISGRYFVSGIIRVSVNGVVIPYSGSIDFGTVNWGEDAVKTVLIENTGTAVMEIYSSIVLNMDFTVPATSLFLQPGTSTNLTVVIPKTSTPGSKSSSFQMRSSAGNYGYFGATLRGTVASSGEAEVSVNGVAVVDNQTVVDFGGVTPGGTLERTINITNSGVTNLRVGPATGPAGVTFLTNFTMNQVIAPGATASIIVRMSADQIGQYIRTITIPNSDQNESNYEVQCEIRGRYFTPSGEIDVEINGASVADRSTVNLGAIGQGTTVVKTITVRNRGTSDLKLNPASYDFGMTWITNFSTGQVIPAGGSATIMARLNSSNLGSNSTRVYIPNSDGDEDGFTFTLNRSIVPDAPEIVVSSGGVEIADNTGAIDFGSVVSGGSISKTFTVTNIGVRDLVLQPLVAPAGFSIIGNFAKNQLIAPGTSVNFTIRMNTTTPGSYSGQIAFVTNDSDERTFDFRIFGRVI